MGDANEDREKAAKRKSLFEQLTTTLKAHETGVADVRNAEENEANEVIAALSELDVDSPEFDEKFAEFKQAVSDHAEAEEKQEFPTIQSGRSASERKNLGDDFLAQFEAAGGKG